MLRQCRSIALYCLSYLSLQDGRFVPGAGATEIELAKQLTSYAQVCMCVCYMCVCVAARACVHARLRVCVCARLRVCVHVWVCMPVCVHTCVPPGGCALTDEHLCVAQVFQGRE